MSVSPALHFASTLTSVFARSKRGGKVSCCCCEHVVETGLIRLIHRSTSNRLNSDRFLYPFALFSFTIEIRIKLLIATRLSDSPVLSFSETGLATNFPLFSFRSRMGVSPPASRASGERQGMPASPEDSSRIYDTPNCVRGGSEQLRLFLGRQKYMSLFLSLFFSHSSLEHTMIGFCFSLLATLAALSSSATPIRRQSGSETYPAPNVVPAPQQSWIDTYNLVRDRIPSLPPSIGSAGVVSYAGSRQPNCSWSLSKCLADDIHAASTGIVALGFDDVSFRQKLRLQEILRDSTGTSTGFDGVIFVPPLA